MKLLGRQYGNPFKLLACYRHETKRMTKIKPGDAAEFSRLFNFLIKYKRLQYSNNQNLLDTPDVICMILLKVPVFLQDRWNRHVHKIRKNQTREPGLLDLTNFTKDEMALVIDPLYSREAVGQYEDKPLKPHKPKKMQSYAIKETRKEKLQSAQYVKTSMILGSAQQFWNKLLRIEVRPFTRNVFLMVV